VAEGPRGKQAAQDFQAGTSGAYSDLATGKSAVSALRYDNPKEKGLDFIKFDGIEDGPNGTALLIDAKTKLATWNSGAQNSVMSTLERVDAALKDNPEFKVIYEFPNAKMATAAKDFINGTKYKNTVTVRVRKTP